MSANGDDVTNRVRTATDKGDNVLHRQGRFHVAIGAAPAKSVDKFAPIFDCEFKPFSSFSLRSNSTVPCSNFVFIVFTPFTKAGICSLSVGFVPFTRFFPDGFYVSLSPISGSLAA
jgi:hypothetical protein